MPAIYKGKQMDKSTEPCVAHQPYFQEKLKKIFEKNIEWTNV